MNILICLLINELSLYLHTYFKLYIRYQVPGVVKYQYRIRLYVDYSTPYLVCRYCCCWIREQRAPHTPCTSICAFNSQVPLPMNSTLCSRWPRRKNHGEWMQNEECVTHNEGMTYNEGMAHTESTPTTFCDRIVNSDTFKFTDWVIPLTAKDVTAANWPACNCLLYTSPSPRD